MAARRVFGKDPLDRRARAALQQQYLSERVFRAVLRLLPDRTTNSTLRQLNAAIFAWRGDQPDTRLPPALAESWVRDGGTVRDLERLRTMIRYRWVRDLLRTGQGDVTEAMRQATDELRKFWVTTGHDVVELDQFMADVDAEFPDLAPG